jgi:hypothetical protein
MFVEARRRLYPATGAEWTERDGAPELRSSRFADADTSQLKSAT